MDSKEDGQNNVQSWVVNDDEDQDAMDTVGRTGVLVKLKWRGTSQDKIDMEVMGRHQVLRVSDSHTTSREM